MLLQTCSRVKQESESDFKNAGAFDGMKYRCYYSRSEPLIVLLKKNEPVGIVQLLLLIIGLCFGIGIFVGVKFFGHKCNCPSQSQLIKQQQQQR